ncbi:hypothetical protein JYL57_001933 [Salmonella enterica subsp. enterica serovar Typhimurium]|nr:hypothetical protein [Salmonella enterica subsp. enterica serovar Typhimurium]
MTRIIEIYSRLDAINELLALMLQRPDIYREQAIGIHVGSLVEYVNHVNAVIWRQQERGGLSDFEARYTLPAITEIWLQVKQTLTMNNVPLSELSASIAGLISLVSLHLSNVEGSNDKSRVLH